MSHRLWALIISLAVAPSGALAQTTESADLTTESPAETTDLTTETPVNETAFDLPAPTRWEFFKRRFVHFFTLSQVKRLRQELELANLTLLAAQDEEATGDAARSATLLDRFTTEMERISGLTSDLAADLATRTDDAQIQSLLETIQADRLLQASATEQLSATTQAELQAKALKARTSALRDLAKLLAADDPSPAKFQERLGKIAAKLAKREAKLERKIAKRLAALEALDEEIEDPELEDAIQAEAADELDDVAALDEEKLGTVVRQIEGTLAKHLLVLQALLDRVPETARPALQEAIDRSVERLKERLTTDADLLDELFDEDHEAELQEKLLERLGKETEKATEAVKEAVEKRREQTQKALERERQRARKAAEPETQDDAEDEDEDDRPAAGSGSTGQTTGGTTAGSSGSTSGSSGGSPGLNQGSSGSAGDRGEVRTETKEVEVEDRRFKTTAIEVERGTQLTVTLKNKDSVAHTFSIVGTSTSTGSVSPGQEKSVTVTVDRDLEFACDLHPSMTHGTIRVKN